MLLKVRNQPSERLVKPLTQIAAGSLTGAAGAGRVNFIDTRDVADVARIALPEEIEPTSQRAYHLSGPRAWTMNQVAQELWTSGYLRRPFAG